MTHVRPQFLLQLPEFASLFQLAASPSALLAYNSAPFRTVLSRALLLHLLLPFHAFPYASRAPPGEQSAGAGATTSGLGFAARSAFDQQAPQQQQQHPLAAAGSGSRHSEQSQLWRERVEHVQSFVRNLIEPYASRALEITTIILYSYCITN